MDCQFCLASKAYGDVKCFGYKVTGNVRYLRAGPRAFAEMSPGPRAFVHEIFVDPPQVGIERGIVGEIDNEALMALVKQ